MGEMAGETVLGGPSEERATLEITSSVKQAEGATNHAGRSESSI